jgi:hypothetical protein
VEFETDPPQLSPSPPPGKQRGTKETFASSRLRLAISAVIHILFIVSIAYLWITLTWYECQSNTQVKHRFSN